MISPTHAPTLLAALMVVLGLIGLAWLKLGLGLRSVASASHVLAAGNLLLAAAVASYAGREVLPHWIGYWASDVLAVAAFAAMRAAVPVIDEAAPAWRSAGLALAGCILLLTVIPYGGSPHRHRIVVFAGLGLLSLLASQDAWRRMRRQLRWPLSLGLSLPLFAVTLIMGLRLGQVWLWPEADGIGSSSAFNVRWLWACLLVALLLNATMAGLVLLRLVLHIQRLTRHDPLTEALNRRALSEAIELAHGRLQRGRPYALVLLDLDHFKDLNDGLGHAAGDAALCRLVALLRAGLRAGDSLGRLGGEEFCLLLPLTDAAGAVQLAERLCAALAGEHFEWKGRSWPLSASFGVAQAQVGDISAEAVLHRADQAMYAAKAAGRNCVRVAG